MTLLVLTAARLATTANGSGMKVSSSDRWIQDGYRMTNVSCSLLLQGVKQSHLRSEMEDPNGNCLWFIEQEESPKPIFIAKFKYPCARQMVGLLPKLAV